MAFGNMDNHSEDGDEQDIAEINIIPLVDVMLVLLIVFMVAAPLSITGIKVSLPGSKAKGAKVDENRIILSIDSNGGYFIDKMEIPTLQLETKLTALFEPRERKELFIRADRSVPYGKVITAMSAAKLAGVSKMAMLTKPVLKRK